MSALSPPAPTYTCIPGTWRLRVKVDVVSAEGKPFHEEHASDEHEIPECPSS